MGKCGCNKNHAWNIYREVYQIEFNEKYSINIYRPLRQFSNFTLSYKILCSTKLMDVFPGTPLIPGPGEPTDPTLLASLEKVPGPDGLS